MPIIKIHDSEHAAVCRKFKEERQTIDKLALEYKVSTTCIERILRKHGCRRSQRKHDLNLSYFENIDTRNKAYFLGLLFADGCNQRSHIHISLQEEDGYLIEAFKKDLNFSGSTHLRKKKKPHHKIRVGLDVCSVKMCNDLNALGCVPNKSLVLKFPSCIKEDLMPHFIRGYFDGDGSIHRVKGKGLNLVCSFTGSPFFCQGLHEYLKARLKLDSSIHEYSHSKAKDVKLSTRASLMLLDFMYKNAEVKMTRKFQKFIDFLQAYNPTGTGGSDIRNEDLNRIKNFWLNSVGVINIEQIGTRRRNGAASMYLGVETSKGKITSRFRIDGERIYLGEFNTQEGAARAYDFYSVKNKLSIPLNFPADTIEFNQAFSEKDRRLTFTPETRKKISKSNSKTQVERYGAEKANDLKLKRAGLRKGIKRGPLVPVVIEGIPYKSMNEAAKLLGICPSTVKKRYVLKINSRPFVLNPEKIQPNSV